MLNETNLRSEIIDYIVGNVSLDEFEDKFVEQSWNMHQHSAPSAIALAGAVELRLGEHSSGHLSEDELKAELRNLVTGVMLMDCPGDGYGSGFEQHFYPCGLRWPD